MAMSRRWFLVGWRRDPGGATSAGACNLTNINVMRVASSPPPRRLDGREGDAIAATAPRRRAALLQTQEGAGGAYAPADAHRDLCK